MIDRHHVLDDIAEAYRYVETEQKTGIVVIDVTSKPNPADLHDAAPVDRESA